MLHDICLFINANLFCSIRFGSIIVGAVKAKLSAKKEKNGEKKGSSEKKKRQHGSFSFLGGMQVVILGTVSFLFQEDVVWTIYNLYM